MIARMIPRVDDEYGADGFGGVLTRHDHPVLAATFMEMSSMSGKVTSTSFMSRKVIFSLMVRSQAMWL